MVSRALTKGFRSATVYSAVEEAVHKCVPELPSVLAVHTKLVNDLTFTVPVATFVKHEVKKNLLIRTIWQNGL